MRKLIVGILAILCFSLTVIMFISHSFKRSAVVPHPDFGQVELLVLWTDGFLMDPHWVVVRTKEGNELAHTASSSYDMRLRCNGQYQQRSCRVFDISNQLIHEADTERWMPQPAARPMAGPKTSRGFMTRKPNWIEAIQFSIIDLTRGPIVLIGLLLSFVGGFFVLRFMNRLSQTDWRELPPVTWLFIGFQVLLGINAVLVFPLLPGLFFLLTSTGAFLAVCFTARPIPYDPGSEVR